MLRATRIVSHVVPSHSAAEIGGGSPASRFANGETGVILVVRCHSCSSRPWPLTRSSRSRTPACAAPQCVTPAEPAGSLRHVLIPVRWWLMQTGASSGVGEAIARDFAGRGWTVAAMARRATLLDEMAADPATKGNIHSFPCDVADSKAVLASVSTIEAKLGAIDVLVLNAAVGHPGVPTPEDISRNHPR